MVVKDTYVVWEFHWKSNIFWKLIFGIWMAILTKLRVWILKFIIQGFQNQTSYLWIITMTSSIYPFMKACQKWIWHTILSAFIWSLFPFKIRQLEVKSKVCEWFPFTESYPKSGNFHEVKNHYLTHHFTRFGEKFLLMDSDDSFYYSWALWIYFVLFIGW